MPNKITNEKPAGQKSKSKPSTNSNYLLNKRRFQRFLFLEIALFIAAALLIFFASEEPLTNRSSIPIIIIVALFLAVPVYFLPKFFVSPLVNDAGKSFEKEKETLKLEDDSRKTIAQIVGGIIILGGLIFTFNTYRLQVKQTEIQTKQQETNREGQITDRFNEAVSKIGDDRIEIRLGGLYALERIAKDSSDDYWSVMEILAAYIRERSKKIDDSGEGENLNKNINAANNATKNINLKPGEANLTNGKSNAENKPDNANAAVNNSRINKKYIIPIDIQTALDIIGRRKTNRVPKPEQFPEPDRIINLTGAKLRGADFSRLDLSKVRLSGADLDGVDLGGIKLREVDLSESVLKGRSLRRADLSGANLEGTDLSEADLTGANLERANLTNANLREATLNHAILSSASLKKANLYKTTFRYAQLIGVNAEGAKFEGANFFKADLSFARLQEAIFPKTCFKNAMIQFPVNLTLEQMKDSIIDDNTTLSSELEKTRQDLIDASKINDDGNCY